MAGGAGIDGGPPTAEVLSDVRRHVERAHVGDKRCRVIALVGANGDPRLRADARGRGGGVREELADAGTEEQVGLRET
jgi:hypothetical protein